MSAEVVTTESSAPIQQSGSLVDYEKALLMALAAAPGMDRALYYQEEARFYRIMGMGRTAMKATKIEASERRLANRSAIEMAGIYDQDPDLARSIF